MPYEILKKGELKKTHPELYSFAKALGKDPENSDVKIRLSGNDVKMELKDKTGNKSYIEIKEVEVV